MVEKMKDLNTIIISNNQRRCCDKALKNHSMGNNKTSTTSRKLLSMPDLKFYPEYFIKEAHICDNTFWNYVHILRRYSDTKLTNRKKWISDL